MKLKLSEYKLRQAIKKMPQFKEFVSVYKDRMSYFNEGDYEIIRY